MKYLSMASVLWDNIIYPNGDVKEKLPGGAGIYALTGMRIWEKNVQLLTGVGRDYLPLMGAWFHKNNILTDSLMIKDELTAQNIIQYFS